MKKNLFIIVAFIIYYITISSCFGQGSLLEEAPIKPVSPTVYEFMKYGEIPVSEYSGVPNISIPLYTINTKHISIPIQVNYHSGGLKVQEEASNIGLGWNMHFGTITQIINDADDFGTYEENGETKFYKRSLPDYHGTPITSDLPKHKDPPLFYDGRGWYTPYPIYEPQAMHSFKIATNYYYPIQGDFNTQHSREVINHYYDSEPDIFTANFFGHSFKFMIDVDMMGNRELIILNNAGYYIEDIDSKTDNFRWKVIAPDGNKFYFEEMSEVLNSNSYTSGGFSGFGSSSSTSVDPNQRVWYISKIVNPNSEEIVFNYSETEWLDNLPIVSEKYFWEKSNIRDYNRVGTIKYFNAFSIFHDGLVKSESTTKEKVKLLNSIEFSKGTVFFSYSNRIDINGAKKLDKILIRNSINEDVKTIDFNQGYFVSSTNGNSYTITPETPSEKTHRLKLNGITINNIKNYSFKYNETLLPNKFSYAVDYWGYYNGVSSNVSFVPNPARFGRNDISSNGNNKSANLSYTKACILEEISYPTGGITKFEYELNTFDNYWVSDYGSSNNSISKGNGLRIRKISNYSNETTLSTSKIYTYENGISLLPLSFFTNINFNVYHNRSSMGYDAISAVESNNSFGFSPSPFGSGSGVGYGKVTIKNVDLNDNSLNGKRVLHFANNEDIIVHSANMANTSKITLPSRIDENNFRNGTLILEELFDMNEDTVQTISYDYYNTLSDIYYGVKMVPFGEFFYYREDPYYNGPSVWQWNRTLLGYYPIYDFNALIKSKIVKEYIENKEYVTTTSYIYDKYNLLKRQDVKNAFGDTNFTLLTYPNDIGYQGTYSSEAYDAILSMQWNGYFTAKNIHIGQILERKNTINGKGFTERVNFKIESNGNLVQDFKQIAKYNESLNEVINYIDYDDKGNLLEVAIKDGASTVYIWGYNQNYPIAIIENATYSDVESFVSNIQTKSDLDDDNCLDSENCNETNLRNAMDSLRSSLINSMVTTYTYDPLIGVTSITNPRGETIYYEYDTLNRLEFVKDAEGNILSKNEYNYKQ